MLPETSGRCSYIRRRKRSLIDLIKDRQSLRVGTKRTSTKSDWSADYAPLRNRRNIRFPTSLLDQETVGKR
ncbi:hypothetical protein FF011L_26440 [Roseimaritima multifibrata]|uniref:Uncharacterized protein n=1 Tax=Roseimaritima multifibrata TaxID=1930274 RepID=A0A517MG61_9BACT|nr:hypothetical protein FF011L_26440 [Roseimaritima multifibrata]